MDEREFKATLKTVNAHNCVFEKTMLSGQGHCEYAEKFFLAEREGINCCAEAGEMRCRAWIAFLQKNCLFALKLGDPEGPIPHGKAVKLQIGGLTGLHQTLHDCELVKPVENINQLIEQAYAAFDPISKTPLTRIIPAISAFKNKKRSRR